MQRPGGSTTASLHIVKIAKWPRVILESPYGGDVDANRLYALVCLRDMLHRGEAPFASHLLYPLVLTKYSETERRMGMEAGLSWTPVAELVAVYTDRGVTPGMSAGITRARHLGVPIEFRKVGWSE